MSTKIGGPGGPRIANISQTESTQSTQQTTTPAAGQQVAPKAFEPSAATLANQTIPSQQSPASQGIKAGLLPRKAWQGSVGQLMGNAKKALDKLETQMNWRMGRARESLINLFNPRPAQEAPPIQAMYGVIVGPGIGGPGNGGGGPNIQEPPPIQAMYGVIVGPGIGGPTPDLPTPGIGGQEPPPIQAMYGVIVNPDNGGGGGGSFPIQPMYGVNITPPGDWTPPIQPKYGVISIQARNVQTS